MGAFNVRPETPEERLIHGAIAGTWIIWLLGGLYLAGPLVGYLLIGIVVLRALGVMEGPLDAAGLARPGVVLWIAGMGAMLIALIVAHVDLELGLLQTLKSAIGWLKGWALFAVFIVAGAVLKIRPAVIYRATALLAAQTLVLVPLFVLAVLIGLPAQLYVSPLQILGGPGPEFFDVTLYSIDNTTRLPRWRFFAPWSTAAAFVAALWLVLALYEKNGWWKGVAIAGALAVCLMTGSRLALVAMPLIVIALMGLSNLRRPEVFLAAGLAVALGVLAIDDIMAVYQDFQEAFTSARAASSRVREALANIAYHRWLTEAPVFGHGVVERGPHLVQFMPIGSHHTWLGLLFVKGAVGFLGLALPLAWTLLELAAKAQVDRVARAGLGIAIAICLFSLGDNLEILAYIIWPGLVVIGMALKRPLKNPFAARMGAGAEQEPAFA